MEIVIISVCVIGTVFCLYKLFGQFMDKESKFLFMICSFITLSLIGVVIRDSVLEKSAEVVKTTIGIGKVIRIEEYAGHREVAIKYTVLRLNNIDYRCRGYVDGAKELRIVRSQNSYTLYSTYNCESL